MTEGYRIRGSRLYCTVQSTPSYPIPFRGHIELWVKREYGVGGDPCKTTENGQKMHYFEVLLLVSVNESSIRGIRVDR
jgi:hypothetical protein